MADEAANGYDEIVKDITADEPPAPMPAPVAKSSEEEDQGYDPIVQGMTADKAELNNISNATAKPDESARALILGKQLDVPAPAVEQNLPLYEQQAQTAKNNAILKTNPVVAAWVAENSQDARMAQDDYENLDGISKSLIAIQIGKNAAEQSNEMGRMGFEKQMHVALPGTDDRIAELQRQMQQDSSVKLDWLNSQLSKVSGFAGGLVDNFINGALPGAAAGAVVGAPEGGVGAVPGAVVGAGIGLKADMARIAAGNTYLALKQMTDRNGKPIDETAAQTGSVIAGLGTYVVAGLGVNEATKAASSAFTSELVQKAITEPTIAGALKNFGMNLAKSGVTFAALNTAMEGSNILGEQVAKITDSGNFNTILNDPAQRQNAMSSLISAAVDGLMLGPLMELPGGMLHLSKDYFHARQAEANTQGLQNVMDGVAGSKLGDRSAEAMKSFLQRQTDGRPVENLYIPAEKIREMYQAHGVDPNAPGDPLFGFQKDMAQQLAQAEPNGGDVVIPTADFLANLSKKPIGQKLLDDIRTSADGMSLNDAKVYQETYRELAKQQGEQIIQAAQQQAAQREPKNKIFADIQNQLMATGKFKPDQIQQYAALFAARYAARGARLGKDPYALYKDSNILIRNEDMPAAEKGHYGYHVDEAGNISRVLPSKEFRKIKPEDYKLDDLEKNARDQIEGSNAGLTDVLDYLKNPPKQNAVERNKERSSLATWLKSKGGLKDAGGDLKAMDANKEVKGLINNKKGKSLDDMALAAQEAGFFEDHGYSAGGDRIDIPTFLKFLDQDLRERNVKVRKADFDPKAERRQAAEALDGVLSQHDIPYTDRDNSEIIKEMEEKGLLPAPEELSRDYGDHAITPEAADLIRKVDEGGVPGMMTANLKRIASENGIEVTPETSPNDVIEALREKEAAGRSFEQGPTGTLDQITASPEFKKWFGDSKVVDGEGKPQVVYHGTIKEFDHFHTSKSEMGAHFGTKEQVSTLVNLEDGSPTGANIIPAYLSIRNPVRLVDTGMFDWGVVLDQLSFKKLISDKEYEAITNEVYKADRDGANDLGTSLVQKFLKFKGYDGIVYLNRREGFPNGQREAINENSDYYNGISDDSFLKEYPETQDSWIVFNPTQIKSIHNRGTFDPADARILYQSAVDKTAIGDQFVLVGGEQSAKQLAQSREDAGRGMKTSGKEQKAADEGLFADREAGKKQGTLFQSETKAKEYADLLRNQRAVEGLRTAMRDPETGKSYVSEATHAETGNYIKDKKVAERIHNEWDRSVETGDLSNVGFLDEKGRFITRDQAEKKYGVSETNAIRQSLLQNNRGSISFSNNDAIIRLFGKSDLSTLLHEGGHQWLEELRADAMLPDAPAQLKADWQMIKDHLGIGDLPDTDNVPTAAHEQFARSIERYLMESKAPSEGLRGAFERFAEWLTNIYRSVAELNAPINADIRKVFDRMFASDSEIAQMESVQSLRPLFHGAKEAKMTDAEFEAYRKLADTAQSKSREELMRRALDAVRKERTKEWRDQYAAAKPDVEKEINARPDIRAMQYMKTGKLLDAPAGTDIPAMKFGKWELDAMRAGVGNDQLPRSVPPMVKENGGYAPDDIAAVLGYESGDKLVDDLMRLRQQEDALRATGEKKGLRDYMVDQAVKNKLLEKNGDILSEGSITEEAMRAVHNASRADLIAADVAALARQAGKQGLPAKVVREWAAGVIDNKLVRDATQLALYERAEAKAGRAAEQALLKGDIEEAFKQKQQQQFSHSLYSEARAALDDVNKGLRRMKWYAGQDQIKSMRQDELGQIHAILEKLDLRPASGPELQRRASFAEWVNSQLEEGHEVKAPPDLLERINQTHYSQMRMTDFRLVADAVENIATIGRAEQRLIKNKERADFQEEIDKTVQQSAGLKRRAVDPDESYLREARKGMDKANAKWLSAKAAGRSFDSSLIKMEQLVQWLDHNNPLGQFNSLGFRPIKDARTHENNLLAKVKPEVDKAVAHLDKETLKGWRDRHVLPELKDPRTGKPMSMLKSQIVSIALNTGNESNMFKLIKGYAWDEGGVRAVLNRYMTKGDWDYVQGMWDVLDHHLWPELEAREKRMSGLAPEKIEARPVQTPFGEYRGGYFPVVYDALRFDPTGGKAPSALFEQTFGSLSSKHGSTIERNERAAHPILLSQGVIPRHITSLIHDIAFREPVMSVDRFFRNKEVRGIVENVFGPEYYKQIRPWLKAVANEKIWDERGLQFWDNAAKQLRVNATLVNLGYNPITVAVHSTTAAANSIAEIGHAATLDGVKAFFGTPRQMAEARDFVFTRSDFMKHRMNEIDRDVRDGLRQIEGKHGLLEDAQRFAYYGISMGDMASAMPTWHGAYSKFLKTMSEEDAIYAADQAVRNAHGSGGVEDIAAIQRGNEFQKLTTMFYSFWNHFYNRQRDIGRRFGEAKSAGDFAQVLARSVYYFVLPMLIHGIFRPPQGQDDEKGLGGIASFAAHEIGLGLVSGIPIVRDIASAGFGEREYQFTPAAQAVSTMLMTGRDAARATGLKDGEVSSHWLKHAIQTAGYTFGLPGAGQVSRYAQTLWDITNGESPGPEDASEWIHAILYGNLASK